jgi:hypothetical protein
VIVQIGLKNIQMDAITRKKQLGGSSIITDGKTDQSVFSRFTDWTTDAKSTGGNDSLYRDKAKEIDVQ